MKKVNHDYKCDKCGKPATWNVQNMFHSYVITEDGDFEEEGSWDGDVNELYCDDCEWDSRK